MSGPSRIRWMEPYRVSVRTSFLELREFGRREARTILRTFVIGLLLTAAIVGWATYAFSAAAIPWCKLLLGVFVAWPFLVAYPIGIALLSPSFVEVRREWVQFKRGANATRIPAANIQSAEVITSDGGVARLRLEYLNRRGRQMTAERVVSKSVDQAVLRQVLHSLRDEAERRVPV